MREIGRFRGERRSITLGTYLGCESFLFFAFIGLHLARFQASSISVRLLVEVASKTGERVEGSVTFSTCWLLLWDNPS